MCGWASHYTSICPHKVVGIETNVDGARDEMAQRLKVDKGVNEMIIKSPNDKPYIHIPQKSCSSTKKILLRKEGKKERSKEKLVRCRV